MRRNNRLGKGRNGPTSCWCDCPINCGSTCFWNVGMCGPAEHGFMGSYCSDTMCDSGVDGCCNYYPTNCSYALTEALGTADSSCGDDTVPGDGSWWDCDEEGYCWGGMNCYELCEMFLGQICGMVSDQFDLGDLPWSPNSEYGFYTWNDYATCGDASDGLINDFCSNNPTDEICDTGGGCSCLGFSCPTGQHCVCFGGTPHCVGGGHVKPGMQRWPEGQGPPAR